MSIYFLDQLKEITDMPQRRFEIRKACKASLEINDFLTAEKIANLMDDQNSKDGLIFDICEKLYTSCYFYEALDLSIKIKDETDRDICLSQIAVCSMKNKKFDISQETIESIRNPRLACNLLKSLSFEAYKARNRPLSSNLLSISNYYDFD